MFPVSETCYSAHVTLLHSRKFGGHVRDFRVRHFIDSILLALAATPFIYYLISIHSSWKFFHSTTKGTQAKPAFTPPVSNIKPIRGLDPDAYENFATLCRQDYPEYELLFCISPEDKSVLPVLEKLALDFPERKIRILSGSGSDAANDKVAKLARLVSEASYDFIVINDSDVRVSPDYLRQIVAPLADPNVGAATCLYVSAGDKTFADRLQSMGMLSDFFPGILVARQLDGVKFTLGTSIATTRQHLAGFGGYESLQNRPADDLLVGRLIAEQGYKVELLPYTVETVPDYSSLHELLHKRLRWTTVMRYMRPLGHLGLIFTLGLPWAAIAVAVHPTLAVAVIYFGIYFLLRAVMLWVVAVAGLKRHDFWSILPLIVLWDAFAVFIWLASFCRTSIRWRNSDYYIRDGALVPAPARNPTV